MEKTEITRKDQMAIDLCHKYGYECVMIKVGLGKGRVEIKKDGQHVTMRPFLYEPEQVVEGLCKAYNALANKLIKNGKT